MSQMNSIVQQLSDGMNETMNKITKTKESFDKTTEDIQNKIDSSLSSASFKIGKTIDIVQSNANDLKSRAEDEALVLKDSIKQKEDLIFKQMTGKVVEVIEKYPTEISIAAIAIGLIAIPQSRRILWRSSFGRFETEERAFEKLTRRAQELKDGTTLADVSMTKFREETKLAIIEMNQGMGKLKSLSTQLKRSDKSAEKSLAGVDEVLGELRSSSMNEALALRSEVAQIRAKLETQRRDAMRELRNIYKQTGIEV